MRTVFQDDHSPVFLEQGQNGIAQISLNVGMNSTVGVENAIPDQGINHSIDICIR